MLRLPRNSPKSISRHELLLFPAEPCVFEIQKPVRKWMTERKGNKRWGTLVNVSNIVSSPQNRLPPLLNATSLAFRASANFKVFVFLDTVPHFPLLSTLKVCTSFLFVIFPFPRDRRSQRET